LQAGYKAVPYMGLGYCSMLGMPNRPISNTDINYMFGSRGPPIGNGLWRMELSHDR